MCYEALLPKLTEQAGIVRLFCLPHAGGGSAPFHRLGRKLPTWLDIAPLNLPGRESRINEPPYTKLDDLARDAARAIEPHAGPTYAILGHSLGAVVAFELLRELRRQGAILPRLLVLAACRAPQRLGGRSPIHELPDAEFLHSLDERYQGIPHAVRTNHELVELLLPTMRADVRLLETYRYVEEEPLDVEVLVLGGTGDTAVSAADLNAWRSVTSGRFAARLLPGGHFFLFDEPTQQLNNAWELIVRRLHDLQLR